METNQVQHSLQSANSLIQAETIKTIDQHLAQHDALALTPEGVPNAVKEDPAGTIKTIYGIARPVLVFLEGALFIAPGWHKALKSLVAALDTLTADQPAADQKMPL